MQDGANGQNAGDAERPWENNSILKIVACYGAGGDMDKDATKSRDDGQESKDLWLLMLV